MNKLSAREVLLIPRNAIHDIQDGFYEVTYDDGTVITNRKKDLVLNRYAWEMIAAYPGTPIVPSCDVKTLIGEGSFNGDTHIRLLENTFKHVCAYNNLSFYYQKDALAKLVYKIFNWIFNEIVQRASADVSTIDAMDFINLIKSEEISKIHANLRPTPESIDRAYKEIKRYVQVSKTKNRFVRAYASKAINENQANQCIGPRGVVTDLDRTVFKQPIMNGFIRGMGNLFEVITESRTAAKSLNANDTHIKTSEYASRRIQLLSMSVTGVDIHDCGSTDYMDMLVTKDVLENIRGKYYVKADAGIDWIHGDETNLIGEIVKLRTSLGCHAPDMQKICTTCLGKVAENFKENSNLGYIMTAYLMEKMTQAILSTKHLTHSVKKALIKLVGAVNKYFHSNDENDIYFNKDLDLKGMYLILPNSKLNKLVDVLNLQHTNIALNKIGELETVIIRDTKSKTPFQETVDISYKDRQSIITKPLLEYIKSITLESDSRGNFVIPLDNYNKDLPVFHNPLKEDNIINFVNRIAGMIETNKDKVSDPYDKLITIFSTVIDKFKCNLSVIEVIVYATTTFNVYNNNYRLGRNSPHARCENKTLLFRHRSASQLLIYEEQSKELIANAPVIFSNVNRMNHPADVMFMPQALVK